MRDRLRRYCNNSRPAERLREPSENREVGVKPNATFAFPELSNQQHVS
jgi:hypothetical protein